MSTRIIEIAAICLLLMPFANAANGESLLDRPECTMHGALHEPICTQSFLTLATGAARLDTHLIAITGHLVKVRGEFLLFQDPVTYRYSTDAGGLRLKVGDVRQIMEHLVLPEDSSGIALGQQACQPVTVTGRYSTDYQDALWSMGTLDMLEQMPRAPLYPGGMSVGIQDVHQIDLKKMCGKQQ